MDTVLGVSYVFYALIFAYLIQTLIIIFQILSYDRVFFNSKNESGIKTRQKLYSAITFSSWTVVAIVLLLGFLSSANPYLYRSDSIVMVVVYICWILTTVITNVHPSLLSTSSLDGSVKAKLSDNILVGDLENFRIQCGGSSEASQTCHAQGQKIAKHLGQTKELFEKSQHGLDAYAGTLMHALLGVERVTQLSVDQGLKQKALDAETNNISASTMHWICGIVIVFGYLDLFDQMFLPVHAALGVTGSDTKIVSLFPPSSK